MNAKNHLDFFPEKAGTEIERIYCGVMATGEPEKAREYWASAVELNPHLARGYFEHRD